MKLFVIIALGVIASVFPANENEKPLILLHVLLAFTLFQLLIADVHPTSNTPPLLGLYIMISMAIAACHVFFACVVLRVHHFSQESKPPNFICVLFIRPVLKLLAGVRSLSRKLSRTHRVDLYNSVHIFHSLNYITVLF